jgi:mono/diheme cytochrome c family protein
MMKHMILIRFPGFTYSRSGRVILAALAVLTVIASVQAAAPGDADRGKTIHDANCRACHATHVGGDDSEIYLRKNRRVNSLAGLMRQVDFCIQQTNADVKDEEVPAVIEYLNTAFYKFEEQ